LNQNFFFEADCTRQSTKQQLLTQQTPPQNKAIMHRK